MFVATIILAVLLALGFVMSGFGKITGNKTVMEGADHLGASHGLYKVIGVLEFLGAVGLLVGLALWPLGVAAGVGIVLLMVGAVIYHIRAGDKINRFGPAAALGVVTIVEVILRIASA